MTGDAVPGGLFAQPWWLDAVAGPGNWGECLVRADRKIVARLPYVIRRRAGFTLLAMPPLTQTLGPWIAPLEGRSAQSLGREKDLIGELLGQLPRHDYFKQNFRPEVTNWLPWHWQGYRQTTRYTYVLDDLSDCSRVWEELQGRVRTDARKAEARFALQVRTDLPLQAFLEVNALAFERQGQPVPYSAELVRRLDQACEQRGCRAMLFAVDREDRIHAVAYIVWDPERAYYLMGGADPRWRSGASSLLLWEAIRLASRVTRVFDFEGSMREPVERFIRGFGARQQPYHQVWRVPNRLLACALHARDAWHDVRGRR